MTSLTEEVRLDDGVVLLTPTIVIHGARDQPVPPAASAPLGCDTG